MPGVYYNGSLIQLDVPVEWMTSDEQRTELIARRAYDMFIDSFNEAEEEEPSAPEVEGWVGKDYQGQQVTTRYVDDVPPVLRPEEEHFSEPELDAAVNAIAPAIHRTLLDGLGKLIEIETHLMSGSSSAPHTSEKVIQLHPSVEYIVKKINIDLEKENDDQLGQILQHEAYIEDLEAQNLLHLEEIEMLRDDRFEAEKEVNGLLDKVELLTDARAGLEQDVEGLIKQVFLLTDDRADLEGEADDLQHEINGLLEQVLLLTEDRAELEYTLGCLQSITS